MYVTKLAPDLESQYNKMFNRPEVITPKKATDPVTVDKPAH